MRDEGVSHTKQNNLPARLVNRTRSKVICRKTKHETNRCPERCFSLQLSFFRHPRHTLLLRVDLSLRYRTVPKHCDVPLIIDPGDTNVSQKKVLLERLSFDEVEKGKKKPCHRKKRDKGRPTAGATEKWPNSRGKQHHRQSHRQRHQHQFRPGNRSTSASTSSPYSRFPRSFSILHYSPPPPSPPPQQQAADARAHTWSGYQFFFRMEHARVTHMQPSHNRCTPSTPLTVQ